MGWGSACSGPFGTDPEEAHASYSSKQKRRQLAAVGVEDPDAAWAEEWLSLRNGSL